MFTQCDAELTVQHNYYINIGAELQVTRARHLRVPRFTPQISPHETLGMDDTCRPTTSHVHEVDCGHLESLQYSEESYEIFADR